jgi:hypothetical protein
MPAVLVTLADAIAAELNAATWEGVTFKAVRSYADWELELKQLGELHVDVVPAEYPNTDLDSRGSVGYGLSLDIGIRKRFEQSDLEKCGAVVLAELDRLVLLVEEFHEFFIAPGNDTTIGRRLQDYPEASWRETAIRAAASAKHLREMQMFLGVIRVTYDVSKSL